MELIDILYGYAVILCLLLTTFLLLRPKTGSRKEPVKIVIERPSDEVNRKNMEDMKRVIVEAQGRINQMRQEEIMQAKYAVLWHEFYGIGLHRGLSPEGARDYAHRALAEYKRAMKYDTEQMNARFKDGE